MRAQVRLLRSVLRTIADLDRAMGAALLEHTKAQLLAPMPRIGEVNLAQITAEVGPILPGPLTWNTPAPRSALPR